SVNAVALLMLLPSRADSIVSPCRSATFIATRWPLELSHGPLPMRSRALTAVVRKNTDASQNSSSERSIEYLDAVVRTVGFCRINVCSRCRPYFRRRPDVPALVLSVTGCCCRRESVPPQTTQPLH